MDALLESALQINHVDKSFKGKVRDNYITNDGFFISVVTDRISAFDHVFNFGIPGKGQILNQIANFFLTKAQGICANWFIYSPHPAVTIGLYCKPIPVEIVVRGYLAGHAWRLYKSGERQICGVPLSENLIENQKLSSPIITPAVKNSIGHDIDISKEELLKQDYLTQVQWDFIEKKALALFEFGQTYAESRNLLLVDTKYEFGFHNEDIILMDEIHTPDSSRYFVKDLYEQDFHQGNPVKHLSKEFFRELIVLKGFNQVEPQKDFYLTHEEIQSIQAKYLSLYQLLTGKEVQFSHFDNEIVSEAINAKLSDLRQV